MTVRPLQFSLGKSTPSSPSHTEALAPSATGQRPARIAAVDAARGLALIGLIAIHLLPSHARGGGATWEWTVFAGRAAALFALLAGVSTAFLTGGQRRSAGRALTADRAALVLRALLIVVIGLLLGYTDSPNLIILPYYGILFLLAVPLVAMPRTALLSLAAAVAVIGPVAMQLVRAWWPNQHELGDDYTFALVAQDPGRFLRDMLLTGFYPALPWLAYICVGIAIGRADLRAKRTALILLGSGTAVATSMWLLSMFLLGPAGGLARLIAATPALRAAGVQDLLAFGGDSNPLPATTGWWLVILAPYTSTPVTILQTLGVAVAALGAVLLLAPYAGAALEPIAALGSMTLTFYSAHIIIVALDVLPDDRPVMSWTFQSIVFLLAAVVWRRTVGKGPLEGMVAAATGKIRAWVAGHAPPRPDGAAGMVHKSL